MPLPALRTSLRLAVPLAGALLLAACSGDAPFSPSDPGVEVTGDLQVTGTVAQVMLPAPVIEVRDGDDRPVEVAVRLEVEAGSVTEDAATDAEGRLVMEDWVLGETAGEQVLTAWVGDEVLATLRARAEADTPTEISGFDFPEVEAGTPVPPATGQLADEFGNPSAQLALEVRRGDEVLLAVVTGADGQVDLGGWTASETAGPDHLSLRSEAGDHLRDLVVPVRPGAPEALELAAELEAPARAGDVFSGWGTAALVDGFGNAVEGSEPGFSATTGELAERVDDPAGGRWPIPDWELGGEVGPAALVAVIDGFADTLDVEVGPGAPAALRVTSAVPDTARTGEVLDDPAQVEVRDAFENPVPDVEVEAVAVEGTPQLSPESALTDAEGVARFEAWAVGLGRESVQFRAPGLDSDTLALVGALDDDAFQVSGLYMNQGNNRPGGAPAVLGRPGQLRILGHLAAGVPVDQVRIRVTNGGTVVAEKVRAGPIPSTAPDPQTDGAGWALELPGADIQPGLRVEVELVAGGAPVATYGPEPLEVADVPVLRKYFVPIRLERLDTTGPLTPETVSDAMQDIWRWMPLNEVEVEIAPVFSTDRDLSDRDEWSALLRDLVELRWDLVASGEITPDTYIHGILPTSIPGSGIGGIGYVPGAPGSSFLASLSRMNSGTIAHELGHNMGRRHTPCGNPAAARPFPHPNARLGFPGYDVDSEAPVASDGADYMSYCGPRWTSDVKFVEIFEWRDAPQYQPSPVLPASAVAEGQAVLVRGAVTPDGARLELRPGRAAPPVHGGGSTGTLAALDAGGQPLASWQVELVEVADAGDGVRHFARVVDLPTGTETVRFEADDGTRAEAGVETAAALLDVSVEVTPEAGGTRVTWDPQLLDQVTVRVDGRLRGSGEAGSLFLPGVDPARVEVAGSVGRHGLELWP